MEIYGSEFVTWLRDIWVDVTHPADADLISLAFRLFVLWLLLMVAKSVLSYFWQALPRPRQRLRRYLPKIDKDMQKRQVEAAKQAARKQAEHAERARSEALAAETRKREMVDRLKMD